MQFHMSRVHCAFGLLSQAWVLGMDGPTPLCLVGVLATLVHIKRSSPAMLLSHGWLQPSRADSRFRMPCRRVRSLRRKLQRGTLQRGIGWPGAGCSGCFGAEGLLELPCKAAQKERRLVAANSISAGDVCPIAPQLRRGTAPIPIPTPSPTYDGSNEAVQGLLHLDQLHLHVHGHSHCLLGIVLDLHMQRW